MASLSVCPFFAAAYLILIPDCPSSSTSRYRLHSFPWSNLFTCESPTIVTFTFFLLFFGSVVAMFCCCCCFVFVGSQLSQLQIFSVSQFVVVVAVLACFVFAFAMIFSWPYLIFYVCVR